MSQLRTDENLFAYVSILEVSRSSWCSALTKSMHACAVCELQSIAVPVHFQMSFTYQMLMETSECF